MMHQKTPTMTPTMRKAKTPATKMTPMMRRTLHFSQSSPTPKKFTIGRQARHKEEMVVQGKVKEAKRKLEDRQRKERRKSHRDRQEATPGHPQPEKK
jgi:hypothetical protein